MHVFLRTALIAASVTILSPAAASAKIVASPLWGGIWQLNSSISKFSSPAGKRSETRVYVVHGNKLSVKATGIDASGKPLQYRYSGAFDGKGYPMLGNPVGDSIALLLETPRRAIATVRKGTVITATATSDVSADGKRLTLKRKTLNGKAAPTIEVLAFDKK